MELKEKFRQQLTGHLSDEKTQVDVEIATRIAENFAIEFSEWACNNCFYCDGWNIKVPLGDKYDEIYNMKELLEIYKEEL